MARIGPSEREARRWEGWDDRTDHRPAVRAARSELADTLVARSAFLPEDDAALVRAVYRDGLEVKVAAALIRRPVSSVSHRLRRLVARMSSPRFAWCLRQLERQASGRAAPHEAWNADRQRVATLCLLQGRTLRDTARRTALSVHHVRRHLAALEALFLEHPGTPALPIVDLRRSS